MNTSEFQKAFTPNSLIPLRYRDLQEDIFLIRTPIEM